MSAPRKGNAAWHSLSDEIADDEIAAHVEALLTIRGAIDSGTISAEYVAASLSTLAGRYACPSCLTHEIDPDTPAGKSGICEVCHKRRQRDGHLERVAQIEAIRECDAAKQQTRRSRIAAGIPTPRATTPDSGVQVTELEKGGTDE